MIVIPGLDMGGAELQLTQKINLFPELDSTVSILSDRYALLPHLPLPPKKIKKYDQPALRYLNTRGVFRAIPVSWQITQHCRAENIRCIIAHLPMAHWTARLSVLFALLFFYRLQVIVYHHSEQYKVSPTKGIFQKIFTNVQSMLARITDAGSVFVSETVRENISAHQFVRNGSVIKNMVVEKDSNPVPAKIILASQNKIFKKCMVVPGRIERVKGQLFFVSALTPELIDKIVDTQTIIVFAGGGADEQELVRIMPERLKENIFITGTLDHEVLLSFLSLADLVVIPSLSEGLGNTLLESMMLKRNVISSDAGGLLETIHNSNAVVRFQAGEPIGLQQKLAAWFLGTLTFHPEKAHTYYRANFLPDVYREALSQFLKRTLSS